jgi:hypothetical protein
MNRSILSIGVVVFLILALTQQANVVVNKLDGISTANLVYSGSLPISDSSNDTLFFTFYSANDAKQ